MTKRGREGRRGREVAGRNRRTGKESEKNWEAENRRKKKREQRDTEAVNIEKRK